MDGESLKIYYNSGRSTVRNHTNGLTERNIRLEVRVNSQSKKKTVRARVLQTTRHGGEIASVWGET